MTKQNKMLPEFVKYGRLTTLASPEEVKSYSDRTLEVFEKIDGGNCQVRNIGGWNLFGGSKSRFLQGPFIHRWPWFQKFLKWMRSNESLYNLPQNFILFGEWMGNHTIRYKQEHVDKFFVLDVMELPERRFMEYYEVRGFLSGLKIRDVNFLETLELGKIDAGTLERLLNEPSDFYEGPKEGLVLKDYESPQQQFFRLYHPEFSELLSSREGNADCLTVARFRKNIWAAFEEKGRKLYTEDILKYVRRDIEDDRRDVPKEKEINKKLNDFLIKRALDDVRKYFAEPTVMGQDFERKARINYLTPSRVRKSIDGILEKSGAKKISYDKLVREMTRYAREQRGNNVDELDVRGQISYLFREGKLRSVEKYVTGRLTDT